MITFYLLEFCPFGNCLAVAGVLCLKACTHNIVSVWTYPHVGFTVLVLLWSPMMCWLLQCASDAIYVLSPMIRTNTRHGGVNQGLGANTGGCHYLPAYVYCYGTWQGKYHDADALFRRSLEIQENALGPDHPNLAPGLGNRAYLLQAQVKFVAGSSHVC